MARWIAPSPDAETMRMLLHPVSAPEGTRLAAAIPAGLFARAVRDPSLSRALTVLAARLDADGALETLEAADRTVAEAMRAWSLASVAAIREALGPLGAAVAQAGIPALLCKGAALHGLLYVDATARPAADVDVFVPTSHVIPFNRVLEEFGYRPSPVSKASVEAFRLTGARSPGLIDLAYEAPSRDLVIEVKADPISIGRPVKWLVELAERATPSPVYPGFLLPSVETMVLQQVFSRARKGAPDLLAHAEIAGVLWVRRREFEAERMLDFVRGEGLYGILRGVLSDTDAAFPGVVPPQVFRRISRPAGFTPRRVRRGTLRPQSRRTRESIWSLWAAPALGGGRPLDTTSWLWARLFPAEPLRGLLAGGRRGLSARWERIRRVARGDARQGAS